ncbi:hypothetical protein BB560_005287 [Smittium megazygosporum]|uniref:Major facilitator superfamily (MFS) profile domain-containing protein n=1 Tax=Smittium megazygosporum TaxID=133381 RepID=A0A2T9Z734_9FUNG|nr:hypothetical protein BB560_005287 [Smittium megazygosporum]
MAFKTFFKKSEKDISGGSDPSSLNNVSLDSADTIPADSILPPDKGYAWVVLLACFINLSLSLGALNSMGVFQTYYLQVMFVSVDASIIAWISTATISISMCSGIASSMILQKIGLRNASLVGSFFGSLGLLLASFSTKIWQLILTQGVIFGFGSGILLNISLSVPSNWFVKHRPIALGIVASGGGLGSLIFVPSLTEIVRVTTIGWAFRVIFFIYCPLSIVCSILLRYRIPVPPARRLLDFKLLKDPIVVWICVLGFFIQIGSSVVFLYFPSSLVDLGYNQSLATNLIMVFSICNALSRMASTLIAKKIKPATILIVIHAISSVIIMAMWYKSTSFAKSLAFYVLIAIFGMPFFALQPLIVANYSIPENVAPINGLVYLVMGISILIAVPSIGKVFQVAGKRHDYSQIILIGFAAYILTTLSSIVLKYYTDKRDKKRAQES